LASGANMSGASRIQSRADFRKWEIRFDEEIKKPAPKLAWRTLLEHHCDRQALKSVLFYAADHLLLAYESVQGNEFDITREEVLTKVEGLKKSIYQLMTLRIRSETAAIWAMFLWGVKKNDSSFFHAFPDLLGRFENILKVLKLPRARQ
jgi:hypothetical protein